MTSYNLLLNNLNRRNTWTCSLQKSEHASNSPIPRDRFDSFLRNETAKSQCSVNIAVEYRIMGLLHECRRRCFRLNLQVVVEEFIVWTSLYLHSVMCEVGIRETYFVSKYVRSTCMWRKNSFVYWILNYFEKHFSPERRSPPIFTSEV